MINISHSVSIPEQEIELKFIRAQGAGGQNVNKVSSAVQLRFDISASSLPEPVKLRLLNLQDQRLSKEGILVIKAQQYRSQDKNREDALLRLKAFIGLGLQQHKKRKATRPGKNAKKKRMEGKKKRAQLKNTRKKVSY